MRTQLYLFFASFIGIICFAQQQNFDGNVGINRADPQENLDVNGIAHADLLYLRNPGEPLELPIKFMASEGVNLDIYEPSVENSSLVNLLELNLNNVPNSGISSYNTGIDGEGFIVAVRSFSLGRIVNGERDLEVYTVHNNSPTQNSSTNTYRQGSPDFAAFLAPSNPANPNSPKTWHIRARYLNSRFTTNSATPSNSDRFTIRLQILVYKRLITKNIETPQTVNLNGTSGGNSTIPKPTGF